MQIIQNHIAIDIYLHNLLSSNLIEGVMKMIELISNIVNVLGKFIHDRATKLKREQKRIEFYNKSFDFLRVSYASWSLNSRSPQQEIQTVQQAIDKFNKELIENEPFFSWRDKLRYKSYIRLARKHALLWSKPNALASQINIIRIRLYQKIILRNIKWLSQKNGRVDEYSKLK